MILLLPLYLAGNYKANLQCSREISVRHFAFGKLFNTSNLRDETELSLLPKPSLKFEEPLHVWKSFSYLHCHITMNNEAFITLILSISFQPRNCQAHDHLSSPVSSFEKKNFRNPNEISKLFLKELSIDGLKTFCFG